MSHQERMLPSVAMESYPEAWMLVEARITQLKEETNNATFTPMFAYVDSDDGRPSLFVMMSTPDLQTYAPDGTEEHLPNVDMTRMLMAVPLGKAH